MFRAIAVAVMLFAAPAFAQEKRAATFQTEGGRYVFVHSPGIGVERFILDTKTGRLWMVGPLSEAGGLAMVPVPYMAPEGKPTLEPR